MQHTVSFSSDYRQHSEINFHYDSTCCLTLPLNVALSACDQSLNLKKKRY